MQTIKTTDYTITYDNSNEIKEKVFQEVIKYFKDNESFIGEVIMQNDNCQINAPEVFAKIADNIIKFQVTYNDN